MKSPQTESPSGRGGRRVRVRRVRFKGDPRSGRWSALSLRHFSFGQPATRFRKTGLLSSAWARSGRWMNRQAETYGPPFYLVVGLVLAAVIALGYVAWVVPARARQARALEELLREKPVDSRMGIVEDRPTLRVLEKAEEPPIGGGLPEYQVTTNPKFLNTDGERAKPSEHAVPVRIQLMEEEEYIDVKKP